MNHKLIRYQSGKEVLIRICTEANLLELKQRLEKYNEKIIYEIVPVNGFEVKKNNAILN